MHFKFETHVVKTLQISYIDFYNNFFKLPLFSSIII